MSSSSTARQLPFSAAPSTAAACPQAALAESSALAGAPACRRTSTLTVPAAVVSTVIPTRAVRSPSAASGDPMLSVHTVTPSSAMYSRGATHSVTGR